MPRLQVSAPSDKSLTPQRPLPLQAEGLFSRLRATPEDLATAQAKYDQLVQDPLVGLELVRSARRYLLSLQRRSRPYGWLYAPLAMAPMGALYPVAVTLTLQVGRFTVVCRFVVSILLYSRPEPHQVSSLRHEYVSQNPHTSWGVGCHCLGIDRCMVAMRVDS